MRRKRTVGNNYSGPRWAFASGEKKKPPRKGDAGGLSMSGGSNRQTLIRRDGEPALEDALAGPADGPIMPERGT